MAGDGDCAADTAGFIRRGVECCAIRFWTSAESPLPCPTIETCPIPWINAGTLHIDFSFVLDQLSLVMLLVVTGVGFLIHIYSVGYMAA